MNENEETAVEQEYVLGTDDDELFRLGLQHQLWLEQAARSWERGGFGPGDTLLDVGCGPGYVSFELSRLVGSRGEVIAVDVSQRFINHLRSQIETRRVGNIKTRVGDVVRLELGERSVDGAYARWVLCFVEEPEAVVAAVAHALRPGKSFVVHDYFNYEAAVIAPRDEIFDHIFRVVGESFRIRKGSPDVGSYVPAMMARCGLLVKEINPLVRIARPGTALWQWPESFFKNYLPVLLESGMIDESEKETFERKWEERSKEAGAFFCTPPMVEIIGVKS
ncbi:MAG TPA: methyltransferase domain-containing protein [Pyrinomonadaceae bacterium]|nr:methyltransferase domain-containing protein [Pyrinomonadaceae bacterium]